SALEGETTTGMAWHLTNAIGGVKLLVMAHDAKRALAVLEEADGELGEDDWIENEDVDADEPDLDNQWQTEHDDDTEDEREVEPEADDHEEQLTRREENADRAFRGAIVGLLFWPLQFYVLWVLVKIFISDERLQSDKRKRAIIAASS